MKIEVKKKLEAKNFELCCPYCGNSGEIYIRALNDFEVDGLFVRFGDMDVRCLNCRGIFEVVVRNDEEETKICAKCGKSVAPTSSNSCPNCGEFLGKKLKR